ncbi:glycosyltransferase family 2 protein [Dolosigranulum pigrum]|nr:glycosyltransferase family 2 protein [Dolosigranulum pigrum]
MLSKEFHNIKISVVIPVYNVEKYVGRCLQSVVDQRIFKQLDIVVVNDGSTDSSLAICQSFAKQYNNIKVISQENSGLAAARITGLDYCQEDYITFIDSDDFIEDDCMEILLNLILSYNADIAQINYYAYFEDRQKVKTTSDTSTKVFNNFEDSLHDLLIPENYLRYGVCGSLFKKEILKQTYFREKDHINEDIFFKIKALKAAKTVVVDNSAHKYAYVQRGNSLMRSPFSEKKLHILEIYQDLLTMDLTTRERQLIEVKLILSKIELAEQMNDKARNNQHLAKVKQQLMTDIKNFNVSEYKAILDRRTLTKIYLGKISPALYRKAVKLYMTIKHKFNKL